MKSDLIESLYTVSNCVDKAAARRRGAGRRRRHAGARARNNPSYFGLAPPPPAPREPLPARPAPSAPAAPPPAQPARPLALSANYSQSTDVLVVGLGL
ncbi:unnamed protein product [Euphydryas editha]|uniref:Uncharacterized protein n=1 Tax=Euphydryas editha TaxID=104508 RepID=A0AAU9UXW1_EUPED|nr:unnamed protein product [Euphydryas editha]